MSLIKSDGIDDLMIFLLLFTCFILKVALFAFFRFISTLEANPVLLSGNLSLYAE